MAVASVATVTPATTFGALLDLLVRPNFPFFLGGWWQSAVPLPIGCLPQCYCSTVC